MALPRDIECPLCGAKVGHGCHSRSHTGYGARTHIKRWQAVGIERPDADDRDADYEDGQARDWEYRRKLFARWRELA